MNSVILIPAYESDEKLIDLVDKLSTLPFYKIIIVNDGSSEKCTHIFETIKEKYNCTIINHSENKGKGYALKTGMREILDKNMDVIGCITVDSDGQHTPKDILKIAEVFEKYNHSLIIGSRDFENGNVPDKSKIGNMITRIIFKIITSKYISDTQTGLRAIPLDAMERFCSLSGDRYELEMNMLMDACRNNMDVREVPIETIYIDENKSSHFNPILDSYKIYREIFKFCYTPLLCTVLNILMYVVFFMIFADVQIVLRIFISSLFALTISRVVNYTIDKNANLFYKKISYAEFIRQSFIFFSQVVIGWILIYALNYLGMKDALFSKIIVEILLFVGFQFIQYVGESAYQMFYKDYNK
ncbi:MAG: glycosyltransferase family 2 protein [Oscillospiraceae bacterium]|nr:glycosyltransferase family 2 protein [Oscillospiraceae bacterium]